jgi:putative nucleotidyltransferase with HDIG domain
MDSVQKIIEKIHGLPSLSPVLARINEVVGNPSSSADDLVDALKLDPAFSSKVLRLANSAYIGLPRTVSSLHNAVVILGQKRIHSLVLSTSAFAVAQKINNPDFDMKSFWRHSVTTAIISESVASYLSRYDILEPGELFCAGMLHDLGKLAIAAFDPALFRVALGTMRGKKIPFSEAEDADSSHGAIGLLLAYRWNFPPELSEAISLHHAPASARFARKITSVIHLADVAAHIMGFKTIADEPTPGFNGAALADIALQPETIRVIATKAFEEEARIEALFEFGL